MINKTLLANKYAHKIIGKGFLETQRLLYEFAMDIDVTTKLQPINTDVSISTENKCPACGSLVIFQDSVKKWRRWCFKCGHEFRKFGE